MRQLRGLVLRPNRVPFTIAFLDLDSGNLRFLSMDFFNTRTVVLICSNGCIDAVIVMCLKADDVSVISMGHRQFVTGVAKNFNGDIRRNR